MVSVIIPVYNTEQYLDRCMHSVLEQTYKDLEVIVVDDGSTDSSGAICDAWQQKDDRVKVFHKDNEGLSATRNFALSKVSGEYIVWVDSDDYVDSRYLEIMLQEMERQQADMIMCGFYSDIDGEISYVARDAFGHAVYTGEEFMQRVYTYGLFSVVWNKLVRAEAYKNISFPVGRIFEDSSIMRALVYQFNKIVVIENPLYYYRRHSASITMKKRSCDEAHHYVTQFCKWLQDDICVYEKDGNAKLTAYAAKHMCHAIILYHSELSRKARRTIKKELYNKYVGYVLKSTDIKNTSKLKYFLGYLCLPLCSILNQV